MIRDIVIAGALASVLLISGCGSSNPSQSDAEVSQGAVPENKSAGEASSTQAPQVDASSLAKLKVMDYAKIQADISEEFPPEMVVIDGEVLLARQQGMNYDYRVRVENTSPEAVLDWYARALIDRQWVTSVPGPEAARTEAGGYEVAWQKGGAMHNLAIAYEDPSAQGGGNVLVTVTLSTSGDLMFVQ